MAEAVHDAERLKELQALPLERKIQITQTRIIEWYQHYNGNVCVSFSGGKDSTVLLHIARRIYPDIPAVFSNTGLEYASIQRFVKTWDNVDIVVPKMRFDEVVSTYGYPLIGKEVAEAIYYARRLRSQTVQVERERERGRTILDKRRELMGSRTTLSRQAERGTDERFCKADGGNPPPVRRRTELRGAVCWKPTADGTTFAANCMEEIGNRGGGGRPSLNRADFWKRIGSGRNLPGGTREAETEPG